VTVVVSQELALDFQMDALRIATLVKFAVS